MTPQVDKWWYLWAGGILALFAWMKSTGNAEDAVSGAGGAVLDVKLTTYWPHKTYTSSAEALMEGGANDAAGKPLYTLEQYQAGQAPYASLSGDNTVFPYGQRVSLDCWPGVLFRIVDTGRNFSSNFSKTYRIAGYEPIDVATEYPSPSHPVTTKMTVYPGDNMAGSKPSWPQALNYGNVQGQDV